ncbi:MAG: hypothetical protein F6K31_01195 [Symploca sp. SIO2G7]|nr:hypothetical protein [Symploca sp. SIO2G7]
MPQSQQLSKQVLMTKERRGYGRRGDAGTRGRGDGELRELGELREHQEEEPQFF